MIQKFCLHYMLSSHQYGLITKSGYLTVHSTDKYATFRVIEMFKLVN